MRILDIQTLQLSHNNFYISINDLNLENDVWYIETSINIYSNFSYNVLQQGTRNPITYVFAQFVSVCASSRKVSSVEAEVGESKKVEFNFPVSFFSSSPFYVELYSETASISNSCFFA